VPNASNDAGLLVYGGVEIGLLEDIARWWDTTSLMAEIGARSDYSGCTHASLGSLGRRLSLLPRSGKTEEKVFISYSGADEDATKGLRVAFATRFQDVFDYRDGKSIRPGQPWIEEISKSLSKSPVCVPLLSSTYVASGNCRHELDDAIALRDGKQTRLFPIKLNKEDQFEIPGALASTSICASMIIRIQRSWSRRLLRILRLTRRNLARRSSAAGSAPARGLRHRKLVIHAVPLPPCHV